MMDFIFKALAILLVVGVFSVMAWALVLHKRDKNIRGEK